MPTSFEIESSVLSKDAAVRSKGWELNSGTICPPGSFNGATDHFSFDIHIPGDVNHPGGTEVIVTGDAYVNNLNFMGNSGLLIASTVTLKPGKYAGSFSLNRSGENTVYIGTALVDADICSVGVYLEPIGGPDDYNFGGSGGSPIPIPWPWACFQNVNDTDTVDPAPVPRNTRSWANDTCPDGGIGT